MIRRLPRTFLALIALGFLAGCATSAPPPRFPDIRFTQEPKLRLDVGSITIQDDYRPPFHAPNVEHLFPVPPARAAETWAHDRLEATGGSARRARVRITDASVVETDLPRTGGITGAFTNQQTERYDATLAMSVDILDDHGFPERTASARVTRTQTVAEDVTPNEREEAWYEMTKKMMADLDRELERQMRATFGYYLQ